MIPADGKRAAQTIGLQEGQSVELTEYSLVTADGDCELRIFTLFFRSRSSTQTNVARLLMVMRLTCLLISFLLFCSPLIADFSDSEISLHPTYPGSRPFLISISGTWPTDCHPGEQLPLVNSFDGYTVEIKFEIKVVHVTCNELATPYRSLVDMSGVLDTQPPLSPTLLVRADYDGAVLEQSFSLECPEDDCSESGKLLPERGLYYTPARAKEGLLLARQNQTIVIYPLVYDEAGNAVWLFGAASAADGTFFSPLTRWLGGDCFDCEPTGADAQPTGAGYISVFIERPDTIWVKINERPFSVYHKLVYGYEVFDRDERRPLADLEGRWALSENYGTDPPLGDLSEILPPTFDVALQRIDGPDISPADLTSVVYLVKSVTGQELGQLVCELRPTSPEYSDGCSFIDPTDQAEPLLLFYSEGPSTLSIEYGRPLPAIGAPPSGKAIRLD